MGQWPNGPIIFQDQSWLVGWLAQGLGGEIHSREALLGSIPPTIPWVVLPGMAPPDLGSVAGRSSPIFADCSDFLGRLSSHVTTFHATTVFFSDDVLRRN